ncbi:MAG: helix-turn-helix domain-containing protein [Nitrospirae bacterium]|jgi:transcriptional regulator with XRE-family HTH domain|nr:helix-turn-helix domain-containing protein [Nitrospirota bacterium]
MKPKELRAWRKRNSYSQNQLAKALTVATMTVSRWERGERGIPSFLRLALERLEEIKGGDLKKKGTRTKKRKEVKK